MFRKFLIISTVLLLTIMLPHLAWSSMVGRWDVQGSMKVKVKIPQYGSGSETIPFADQFIFYSDGQFESNEMSGIWSQTGKKFIVDLDPSDVATVFEYLLGEYGLYVSAEVTGITLSGTEKKNGTMKGKLILNMNVYFYDLGVNGTIKATAKFSGTLSGGAALTYGEALSPEEAGSLAEALGRKVINLMESISTTPARQ